MKYVLFLVCGVLLLILAFSAVPKKVSLIENQTAMANPASAYCIRQGYRLEIRNNSAGQYGVCIFPNNSECEEWAYFRNECSQGMYVKWVPK